MQKQLTKPAPSSKSKDRFLAAAAEEFVLHGYDRCTIRTIAARAGTSIASFSRNWPDKQALFADVFRFHFDPINRAQHDAFDQLQFMENATLIDFIAAFYRPVMAGGADDTSDALNHKVYCQALADPSQEAKKLFRPLVADVRSRLIAIVRQHLPDASNRDVFLAMTVIHGTYVYAQQHGARLATIMGLNDGDIDWADAPRTLAEYVVRGIAISQAGRP